MCVCWGPAFFGKQRNVTAVPPTAPIRQYFVEGLCCLAAGCALRCLFLVVVAPRYLLPRNSKLCSTRLSKPLLSRDLSLFSLLFSLRPPLPAHLAISALLNANVLAGSGRREGGRGEEGERRRQGQGEGRGDFDVKQGIAEPFPAPYCLLVSERQRRWRPSRMVRSFVLGTETPSEIDVDVCVITSVLYGLLRPRAAGLARTGWRQISSGTQQ